MIDCDEKTRLVLETRNKKLILRVVKERLGEDPLDSIGLCMLAQYRLQEGRINEAKTAAEKLVVSGAQDWAALGFGILARCAREKDQLPVALELLYKALNAIDDSGAYNFLIKELALCHLIAYDDALAYSFANKVLQQEPENTICLSIQALTAYRQKIASPTQAHLEHILALEPDNPALYYLRGSIEWAMNGPEAARHWYEWAASMEPEWNWPQEALQKLDREVAAKNCEETVSPCCKQDRIE